MARPPGVREGRHAAALRSAGTGACLLLCMLAAAAAGACRTNPSRPLVVSLAETAGPPVRNAEFLDSYPRVLAVAADLIRRELQIPPLAVSLELYADQGAFETGLVRNGYDPAFARETAATMGAIGGHRRVLVNQGAFTGWSWAARTGLVAHELGHVVQYELGGGTRGTSDQWIREGFAEWLASRVLEELRLGSLSTARRAHRRIVERIGTDRLPRLSDMVTFRDWVGLQTAGRGAGVYSLAFLAVDDLVTRHGSGAFVRYFRLFASSGDRAANFQTAFGTSLEAFERGFFERLAGGLDR
ncbi:MAG TPA: hypothetical protein VNI83_10535 [Vicinamibacterales bacterium]|nr:hypothetical protein [Vicinamibacterales bacterium]